MSNYKKHLDRELQILKDNNQGEKLVVEDFLPAIEQILEVFSNQGHSGMSASFYTSILSTTIKNVLSFKALSPLTGEDHEWNEVGEGVYQNNRQSDVFKENEKAHYNDAIVWRGEEEHDTFTGKVEGVSSSQPVKFPLTTKTFYIDVRKDFEVDKYPESEAVEGDTKYVYRIKNYKQLNEVREYYGIEAEWTEEVE